MGVVADEDVAVGEGAAEVADPFMYEPSSSDFIPCAMLIQCVVGVGKL
jgi:hypothetical protein